MNKKNKDYSWSAGQLAIWSELRTSGDPEAVIVIIVIVTKQQTSPHHPPPPPWESCNCPRPAAGTSSVPTGSRPLSAASPCWNPSFRTGRTSRGGFWVLQSSSLRNNNTALRRNISITSNKHLADNKCNMIKNLNFGAVQWTLMIISFELTIELTWMQKLSRPNVNFHIFTW